MYRQLVKIGRLTRRINPLLASLWDSVRQGFERTFKFRGFIYSTVQSLKGLEIHITCENTGHFLGKVVGGELYQCV